ncbi:hypothetical protein EEDFHM_02201 [Methylorubrum populi]
MSEFQKTTAQRIAQLEQRLKRERGKEASELAKLLNRCVRMLHRECPGELRNLIVRHVKDEDEWAKLKRLGINEYLPPKRGGYLEGSTQEIAPVVPEASFPGHAQSPIASDTP